MADTEGASGRWAFAFFASVLLHAGIIALFVVPGCGEGGVPAADESGETPEVASAGPDPDVSAEEEPSPSAGTPRPVPVRPSVSNPRPADGDESRGEMPAVHVVRAGDTLTKIAKKHGTTPEELARINGKPVKKLNLLRVGQKIKLRK